MSLKINTKINTKINIISILVSVPAGRFAGWGGRMPVGYSPVAGDVGRTCAVCVPRGCEDILLDSRRENGLSLCACSEFVRFFSFKYMRAKQEIWKTVCCRRGINIL